MKLRDVAFLIAAVGLFLASRAVWIHDAPGGLLYFEESYRWSAIAEILAGRVHPWLDYQADHYQGGPLVMIWLAATLARVFGQSFFVFKMVMAGVGATVLSLLFVVAHRAFGARAARIVALLYLTGPPLVALWSLVQLGSHGESIVFSLALLALLVYRPRGPGFAFYYAAGILGGLGTWFCYSTAFTVAACSVALVAATPLRLLAGRGAATGAGFLTGLLPWFYYNSLYGWPGLGRGRELLGGGGAPDLWIAETLGERAARILLSDIPFGLSLGVDAAETGMVQVVAAAAVVASLVLAIAFCASFLRAGERRDDTAPATDLSRALLAYSVVFLGFLMITSFAVSLREPVDYRFYVPWAVLMLLPAAGALARLRESRPRFALCCIVLLATGGLLGSAGYAARHAGDRASIGIEDGYAIAGILNYQKYRDRLDRAVAIGQRLEDAPTRARFLFGLGWAMANRIAIGNERAPNLQMFWALREAPPEVAAPILQGFHWAVPHVIERINRQLRIGGGGEEETAARIEDMRARTGAFDQAAVTRLETISLEIRFQLFAEPRLSRPVE